MNRPIDSRDFGRTLPDAGSRTATPDPSLDLSLRKRPLIRSRWLYFVFVVLFDSLVGAVCVHEAIRFRYDFLNRPMPNNIGEVGALVTFIICVVVWSVSPVPKAIWRYFSLRDVFRLAQLVVVSMVLLPLIMFLFVNRGVDFPRLSPFIAAPFFFAALLLSRLLLLVFRNGDIRAAFRRGGRGLPDAVLVGSPTSLHNALRDMSRKKGGSSFNVVGMIDTRSDSAGRSIRGVPVISTLERLEGVYPAFARRYAEPPRLVVVDPQADRATSKRLVRAAAELGAPLSRVARGGKTGELTAFEAQDLIGRSSRALDITPVRKLVEGRRVLITGAGGSIGSELSRQVARLDPAQLVLVDQSEFNLYTVDRHVGGILGEREQWEARIGDVTDRARMAEIFAQTLPHIVLHAAALKHVPLGEANPLETLRTNVEGTRTLLELSVEHGVEAFTLVSTDKAVNVSNIMGASKHIAEMLVHATDETHDGLAACAVRFGNVLASAGSVIPLFDEQIAAGGPVTVTHPEATRYFMTVEEASALVLQATALDAAQRSPDSSIYVLEMGDPVNIASLARQLIRLRGLVPDRDVKLVYTGLRPGETLAERVVGDPERLETTYVDGLMRITGIDYDPARVPGAVERLLKAVRARKLSRVRKELAALLPSYEPNGGLQ